MNVTKLSLEGLQLVVMPVFRDARGFFMERYNRRNFSQNDLSLEFYQDNHSHSIPGVLRGLHYQHSPPQGKLVGVIRGRIWDVVVDVRENSPTFGSHYSLELNGSDGQHLWVPAGFAHGFCVLGDEPADVLYKTDAQYNIAGEGGIKWNDADLNIPWPLANPVVSDRDSALINFADYKLHLVF